MIFMVKNTKGDYYDPEYDMWFCEHPYAHDYIFAPLEWFKQRLQK